MSLPAKGKKMRHIARISFLIVLFSACAALSLGQERVRSVNASVSNSLESNVGTSARISDPTFIPAGSKVYVNEIKGFEGFENYLVAAFKKKKVDLLVVTDRAQADFEITGYSESQKAGWAKIIFSSGLPEEEASIQVTNLRTSVVAYAVASYKVDAINGKKSTAEHLAKNLRQKMERDLKK
jgi:3D (Asp-Asp-Asp) domain-containing protein